MEALFKYLSKDLIRGLGIGFLISAMLIITYPGEKTQITSPMTNEEIISKAKELGMIEKNKAVPNQGKVPSPQPKTTAPIIEKKPIKINIPNGANLSDIADILYKSSAITDKKKFLTLVGKLKLETKFHTGNYVIPANADIADIITLMSK